MTYYKMKIIKILHLMTKIMHRMIFKFYINKIMIIIIKIFKKNKNKVLFKMIILVKLNKIEIKFY